MITRIFRVRVPRQLHQEFEKQFMLNMICSGDGGVPLFMQLGDGQELRIVKNEMMC